MAQDCANAAVGFRVMHFRGKATAVWYPASAKPAEHAYSPTFSGMLAVDAPAATCGGRLPLVVFSHGYLGCGIQSVFFTEELARHGYVVAAPDHADAFLCHIVPPSTPMARPPELDILKPETWTDAKFDDRRKDIAAVIDGLLADAGFRAVIDPRRIGAAGHSLGGYTVVGMAGGWPAWLDARIRAVLALSPYVMPFHVKQTLGRVAVPLMYQGGTLDAGITPFLAGPRGAFAAANPPVYFVELQRAGHFAWANCGNEHTTASCLDNVANARLIDRYAIAFFDRHLRDRAQPALAKKDPALADYRFRLN